MHRVGKWIRWRGKEQVIRDPAFRGKKTLLGYVASARRWKYDDVNSQRAESTK